MRAVEFRHIWLLLVVCACQKRQGRACVAEKWLCLLMITCYTALHLLCICSAPAFSYSALLWLCCCLVVLLSRLDVSLHALCSSSGLGRNNCGARSIATGYFNECAVPCTICISYHLLTSQSAARTAMPLSVSLSLSLSVNGEVEVDVDVDVNVDVDVGGGGGGAGGRAGWRPRDHSHTTQRN